MFLRSKLFKQISVYTFNNLLNSGLNFLLIPVFTRYLLPDQFGILSLMNTGVVFLMPFILLGANGYFQVNYHTSQSNHPATLSNSFYTIILAFLIFQLLGLIVFWSGQSYFGIPTILCVMVPLLAFFQATYQLMLSYFQITERPLLYSKLNITYTVLNILLAVVLLTVFQLKWEARLVSALVALGTLFLYFLFHFSRKGLLFAPLKTSVIREVLYFGVPLIPHAIGALLLDFAAKLIVTAQLGTKYNGIYSLAAQVSFVISVIDMSISLAYTPHVFKKLAEDTRQARIQIVKISYMFVLVMIVSYFLLIFSVPFLFRLLIDAKYFEAIKLVYIISAGFLFSAIYKVFIAPVFYFKKTKYLVPIGIFNMVLGISLSFLFVRLWGLKGAAFASCISFGIFTVIIAIVSNRVYKLPWFFFISRKKKYN